jgi:hypothetical protein
MLMHYFGPGSRVGSAVNVLFSLGLSIWALISWISTGQPSVLLIVGPAFLAIFVTVAAIVWTRELASGGRKR